LKKESGVSSQILEAEIIAALQEDAQDLEYQTEISAWDSVLGDGINANQSYRF